MLMKCYGEAHMISIHKTFLASWSRCGAYYISIHRELVWFGPDTVMKGENFSNVIRS